MKQHFGAGEPGLQLDTHGTSEDNFTQAGDLYRLLPADEKERLFTNIAASLGNGVPKEIVDRQLAHFDKADPAYDAGVRAALAKRLGKA